ncbi:MAG: ATP-binding cassette domain-containing protein [Candidatus Hodarchaeales archaeon]
MLNIAIHDLSFRYPDVDSYVIQGLHCNIKGPKTIGLLGPNGSGKTTFIKLIAGLLKPTQGKITISLEHKGKSFDTKTHIGFVPENAKLFLLGPTFRKDFLRIIPDEQFVENAITDLHLNHLADKKLYHLSEGQRRLLAHTLAFHLPDKKLFLIDEPTIGLDKAGRKLFLDLVNRAVNQNQTTIISTNDPRILPRLQYLMIIEDKTIKLEGPTKKILYRLEDETSLVPNQIVRLMSSISNDKDKNFPLITTIDEINEFLRSRF